MTVHNERSGRKSTWNLRCNIPNDRYCLNSLAAGGSCCMKTHNSDPTLHCSGIWISCQAAAGNSGPFALVPDGPHVPDCRRGPQIRMPEPHIENSVAGDILHCQPIYFFALGSQSAAAISTRSVYDISISPRLKVIFFSSS